MVNLVRVMASSMGNPNAVLEDLVDNTAEAPLVEDGQFAVSISTAVELSKVVRFPEL